MGKERHANSIQKRAEMAILMLEKIDFKMKLLSETKKDTLL